MAFTKENIQKIFDFIENNSENLIKKESIRTVKEYPDKPNMDLYRWYIVDISGLGEVWFYHTGSSKILRIDGVHASCLYEFKGKEYEKAYEKLVKSYAKIVENKANRWFDEK
jgi:hypothetical protein